MNKRSWKVTVAPAVEPILVAEAKAYLKISVSTDDALIGTLITAARQEYERLSNTACVLQTIQEKFDAFPDATNSNPRAILKLTVSPVVAVTGITYLNGDGNSTTWNSGSYTADTYTKPARIEPKFDYSYPEVYNEINAVTVTYTAGYADASAVPADIKKVLYLLIADAYENRQDSSRRFSTASERLILQQRVFEF